MRTHSSKQVLIQLSQRCLLGLGVALSPLVLVGCTVAETAPDSPSQQIEMPTVRLPSVRLSNRPPEAITALVAEREEETVAISGAIAQRAALLDGWLYEVRDETGSIWVLTDRSEPEVGEQVIVEGVLHYEPIVVGEIDAGDVYLQEKSYRVADDES